MKMIEATMETSGAVLAAKNIRIELAERFPGIKFSVRTKFFSMGNSIDVRWVDGPRTTTVQKVIDAYAAGRFDGMTDCYNYERNAFTAKHGCAKYVSASREVSNFEDLEREATKIVLARCRCEGGRFGSEWVSDLARGMAWAIDFTKGETLETTFRRVVLREAI